MTQAKSGDALPSAAADWSRTGVTVTSGCSRTLFLVGFLSLMAQVVLLRELNVAFYGIELAYLVALAAWMAGTAAGAAAGTAVKQRSGSASEASLHAYATFVLVIATSLVPVDVAFVRGSRLLLGGVPGAYLPLERQFLTLLLAVAPVAVLFGLAFTAAARLHVRRGGRGSRAYAIECAGAAAAGLAATVAFRLGVQNLALAILVAAVGLGAAWRHLWRPSFGLSEPRLGRERRPEDRRLQVGALAILVIGLLAAWRSAPLDARLTRWNHPALVENRDTPYARVTLTRAGAQVAVFENDVLTHDSESVANEELPHLAALQHAVGARILLLGGSAELVARSLARHRPALLRSVEMDRAAVEAVRRWLPLAGDPEIADPRSVLSRREDYDLVVIAAGGPVSGQANRLYTREFFDSCARRLSPGGVLALRLDVPQNYLGPAAVLRAASVARALRGAFRYVDYLPAAKAIALASNAPLPSSAEIVARLRARQLDTHLVTDAYVDYLYTNDRHEDLRAAFAATTAPENRDRQPVAYLYAAASWLSKFWPGLIGADWAGAADPRRLPGAWRWALGGATLLAVAACRRRPGTRRAAIALVAGLAGMILETIVLLHYESTHGALFEDLGLLMMAFMTGSAAGASLAASHRVCRRPPGWRLGTAVLLVALTAWGVVSWWLVSSGTTLGMAGATALLAGVGATVGALFAAANARSLDARSAEGSRLPAIESSAVGLVYGADVLGGCLGSLAASLVLVPLAGMDVAALTVSGLAAASLALAF